MQLVQKVICALTVLMVFLLPISKRLELRHEYTFFSDHYHEYITPSVYSFDIVLVLLAILSLLFFIFSASTRISIRETISRYWIRVAVLSIVLLSCAVGAQYQFIANHYLMYWMAGIFLFYITAHYLTGSRFGIAIALAYIASVTIQAAIGIFQTLRGGSLGLSIMGEQRLMLDGDGIAKIEAFGHTILRAHGTLAHPNLLAIFLFFGIIILVDLYLKKKLPIVYFWIAGSIIVIGLLCTFSRFIWAGLLISACLYFTRTHKQFKTSTLGVYWKYIVLLFIVVAPFIYIRLGLPDASDSLQLRQYFTKNAKDLLLNYPFGVGLGNYTIALRGIVDVNMPGWMYQPVHNTYFLALVELGYLRFFALLGAAAFFILGIIRSASTWMGAGVLALLCLLLFEHAFWDVRQIMFATLFFLAYAHKSGSW